MRTSISVKIVTLFIIFVIILGIVSGWYSISNQRRLIDEEFSERAKVLLNGLKVSSEYPILFEDANALKKIGEGVLAQKDVIYCEIRSADGKVFFKQGAVNKKYVKEYKSDIFTEDFEDQIGETIFFGEESKNPTMEKIGEVNVFFSLEDMMAKINTIRRTVVLLMVGIIVVAFIFISLSIKIFLSRPISNLIQGTQRIAQGDLSFNCSVKTNDEVGELSKAFNKMTDDLRQTTVSRDYVDNIFSSITESLIVLNADLNVQTVNRATCTITGYEEDELKNQPVNNLFANNIPFMEHEFDTLIKKGFMSNVEKAYKAKDGRIIPVLFSAAFMHDANLKIQGIVCVAQDITELKTAQEDLKEAYEELKTTQAQLVQSEKMAGIGQLAAGVAHEINNPTGFIISNLEILQEYSVKIFSVISGFEDIINNIITTLPDKAEEIRLHCDDIRKNTNIEYIKGDITDIISEIKEGAERVKVIVANLRSFAHPDQEQLQFTDINEELDKALSLVWNELKYKCEVVKEYGKLPRILCNPGQLDQVFVNLFINSSQAINNKGTINIRTYAEEDWACVDISDNGEGIPQEKIDKIFEPFFTTKDVGQGTGLGLSIVYGIIKNHRGVIDVKSVPGEGTTFMIKIPARGGSNG